MKIPFLSPPEVKKSKAYALHFAGQARAAAWRTTNYTSFVKEGYKQNVVCYKAIRSLADALASVRWQIRVGDEVVKQHPILDLLRNPNNSQSANEFWRMAVTYLYLSGDLYIEGVANESARRLLELWPLRPDRMEIIPGRGGLPSRYNYKVNGQTATFRVNTRGESPILHLKLESPEDDWRGMSPVNAAAYAIDQHNEAMNWMQSLLQNSARPSGAFTMSAESTLSDKQFQDLRAEIERLYSGAENAGRPMLLEGGLKWESMGLSPIDMEIINIKDSAARDIALAFGVPPLLLNIPGDTTYANYKEARLGFYEDTVIPLANLIASAMNSWFSRFAGGGILEPDLDAIPAIAEKRAARWTMVDNSDELTVNEARDMKGLPPLEDERGKMLLAELRSQTRGHEKPNGGTGDAQDRLP